MEDGYLQYNVTPDGSFFYLGIEYALSLSDYINRYYISDEGVWSTRQSGPLFENLVADRWGEKYRKTGSADTLRVVVDAILKGHSHSPIFESYVVEKLGEGHPVSVPNELAKSEDVRARQYASLDESLSFVFVFKVWTFMSDPREFVVARSVYRLDGPVGPSSKWTLVAEDQ